MVNEKVMNEIMKYEKRRIGVTFGPKVMGVYRIEKFKR